MKNERPLIRTLLKEKRNRNLWKSFFLIELFSNGSIFEKRNSWSYIFLLEITIRNKTMNTQIGVWCIKFPMTCIKWPYVSILILWDVLKFYQLVAFFWISIPVGTKQMTARIEVWCIKIPMTCIKWPYVSILVLWGVLKFY